MLGLRQIAESDLSFMIEGDAQIPVRLYDKDENEFVVSGMVFRIASHKDPQTNLHTTLRRVAVSVRKSTLPFELVEGMRVQTQDPLGNFIDGYIVNLAPDDGIGFINFQVEKMKNPVSRLAGNRGLI
jgi:hypothetical protein